MLKQLKAFRKQEGFTLIELMIVVAIIGILAAIAIPNILQYQMKSRQAEAKTNLGAIRTSMTAFQAERGCYVAVLGWPANAPALNAKSAPFPWSVPAPAPGGIVNYCIAGGTFTTPAGASFLDIGFVSTGSVLYNYGTFPAAAAVVPPVLACGGVGFNVPATILAAPGGGAITDVGFYAFAQANLDADGSISKWGASNDNGSADCTVGVF
jgi:type IV pilus assembly protein PilA